MPKQRKVFFNGNILSMDPFNRTFSALVCEGERILALGDDKTALHLAGASAEKYNLDGKTVLPGFHEAHGHFFMSAEALDRADLNSPPIGSCTDISACLERLRAKAAELPPGQWITGYGYDDSMIAEKRFPTRHDLDLVSREQPVAVNHISGHLCMLNSKALEVVGYTRDTPDPQGGAIRREPDGTPSGILEETAAFMPQTYMSSHSESAMVDLLEAAGRLYLSRGVTSAIDAAIFKAADVAALHTAARAGRLGVRLLYNPLYTIYDTITEPEREGTSLRRGGVKLLQDGSIQGYTAFLSQPYHTPFKGDPAWRGYPTFRREELFALIAKYHRAGVQCVIHANGDAAADDILDAVEAVQRECPRADARHLLVHAQTVREDQLDRFRALSVTPTFFTMHEYYWGDRHRDIFLGPERAARQNPMHSALQRSLVCSAHCDSPVVPLAPLLSLATCVTRKTTSGKVLGPEQRISVMEALRAHTISPAWQNFEEKDKGSLETGKLADMVVLDTDPLACDPEGLRDIGVLRTIVGGETLYEA